MKMVGPVIVLNLILPTADIVSDLLTVIKLYVGAYGCYRSDLALGKPSIKKTIFLLTFINKDFTPPPNY